MGNFDMNKNLNNQIDFLILGALGQMGKAAQNSLPEAIKELETHGLYVRSVNLVDPGYRDIERQTDSRVEDVIPTRKFSALSDVLHLLLTNTTASMARIFIYDASPTPYHFGHLALITQFFSENVCYVGEKPIFTTQDQLAILQDATLPQIYCNFSETMSDVSLRLAEELVGQNIISTNIARISSVSKKKAHGLDRDGVTGGALFDKGIHALAFTIHILGVEKVADYEIMHSRVESLCQDERAQTVTYLDSMNKWDKKKVSCELNPFDWSVDGAINTAIRWRVSDGESNTRQVNSKYYFSWVGAESTNGFADFQKHMADLGFDEREWRLDVDLSKKAGVNLIDEHVRCSIIETERYFYVCNFLSSTNPENDAAIWKIDKSSAKRMRIFPVASGDGSVFNKVREGKTSRVLVESILDWYGMRHAPNLARPITVVTHDVLLKLRDIAYRVQLS
ncbi:MAG: hypothetical protein Q8O94_00330 [bacterium]|nr:hypothetical protein [bacterium]